MSGFVLKTKPDMTNNYFSLYGTELDPSKWGAHPLLGLHGYGSSVEDISNR